MKKQDFLNDKRCFNYTIIIPTYNSWSYIRRVVRGVLNEVGAAEDIELIVIDSSDDGTTERLRESFPDGIKLVSPPERLLPGPARNLGASKATGDIFIFLDGDCLPSNGWLEGFRNAANKLSLAIICGAVDLDEPCDLSQFMEYVIHKLPENSSVQRGSYGFIITENMMIRSKDFWAIGGFGNSDSANDAQMDVARREANLGLLFEPAARVYHIHPRGWRFHFAKLCRIGIETFDLAHSLKGYRIGRWIIYLLPVVFLVKWARITYRVLRYRPGWIGRFFLVQPMLWVGLLAYQLGLWRAVFRQFLAK